MSGSLVIRWILFSVEMCLWIRTLTNLKNEILNYIKVYEDLTVLNVIACEYCTDQILYLDLKLVHLKFVTGSH